MDAHDALVGDLAAIVGVTNVLTDADQRASYESDWTGRYHGAARCVVRPASTDEVAAVVRICGAHGAAMVPQGGNTGLVGGSVPRGGEVVVSTRRLTGLGAVDIRAGQVTVGAGVSLAAARDHARAAGFDVAVDFAARDSATIGGAVATNAGGSRVVRFGTMRAHVAGCRAVLADASIVGSLSGLPKATLGPHVPSILGGSEGTLAILTELRLRLVPWYRQTATALIGLPSLATAVDLLPALRESLPNLDSIELLMPSAMTIASAHLGRPCPIESDVGAYVLVECAAHSDPVDEITTVLSAVADDLPTAIATSPTAREHLVAFRDNVTVAINHAGVPLKLDVAIPLDRLASASNEIEQIIARLAPTARLINFGHLAEGNLHLNILAAGDAAAAITGEVLELVIAVGGAISAEHGIGIAKAHWLTLQRGASEVAMLRALKLALDPRGVLNPGVLLA
ncbi:MAG TPA: FAD-binding oxidoreductase [Ilumatobacteraceae bacterium]